MEKKTQEDLVLLENEGIEITDALLNKIFGLEFEENSEPNHLLPEMPLLDNKECLFR